MVRTGFHNNGRIWAPVKRIYAPSAVVAEAASKLAAMLTASCWASAWAGRDHGARRPLWPPRGHGLCEAAGVDYVFVLPTNAALRADPVIVVSAGACAVKRAQEGRVVLRNYAGTRYGAKSWKCQRRVAVPIEASTLGMDIRYVVTSLTKSSAEHIYDTLYCARDQAENLIKRHKAQLASDRTSCISANANEMRQILHTAAYWVLSPIQQAIPKATALATAEFATLRLRR